jgi:hypothetical protein
VVHSDGFRLGNIEKQIAEIQAKAIPDSVPDNLLDFIKDFRPMIGRKPLHFKQDPFWIEPLLDKHPHQMFVNGRQTYKTTNSSSLISWIALSKPGCEVTYVVDETKTRNFYRQSKNGKILTQRKSKRWAYQAPKRLRNLLGDR